MTKTTHQERLEREAVADRLRELADQLGADDTEVAVGNKTVRLSPTDRVGYEIDVREESSFLRGNRESIEIELEWKPKSD